MEISIFISHSTDDKKKAKYLAREMRNISGLNPIIIVDRRSPRKLFAKKVKEGIEESPYVVPIITGKSINNQWINQEIGYAEAKKKKVFPLIDKRVLNKLKGFIHREEEHFIFEGNSNKRKEAWSFRRSCIELIDQIKIVEGIREQQDPPLSYIETKGKENIDKKIDRVISNDTGFLLKVKPENRNQEFVIYLSFITDMGEQKWIGFGNTGRIKNIYPSEHIFRIEDSGDKFHYELHENILQKIKESKLKLEGKPAKINKIRVRSDTPGTDSTHFYYAFTEGI